MMTIFSRIRAKSLAMLLLPAVGLAALLAGGCQTAATGTPQQSPAETAVAPVPETQNRVYEDFGVEVIAIRTTAAGSMLDFRFKVLDKAKAMPFFREDLKPHLVDEQSGAVLQVPVPAKGGPMRPTSRDPREGITYFMLFANPGGFVQPGNPVTLVIGDLRVENLVVQ